MYIYRDKKEFKNSLQFSFRTYLDLREELLEPPRSVEKLNRVVVTGIVGITGGGHCGPLLDPTHGLLSSLQIRKAIPHLFHTLSLSLKP